METLTPDLIRSARSRGRLMEYFRLKGKAERVLLFPDAPELCFALSCARRISFDRLRTVRKFRKRLCAFPGTFSGRVAARIHSEERRKEAAASPEPGKERLQKKKPFFQIVKPMRMKAVRAKEGSANPGSPPHSGAGPDGSPDGATDDCWSDPESGRCRGPSESPPGTSGNCGSHHTASPEENRIPSSRPGAERRSRKNLQHLKLNLRRTDRDQSGNILQQTLQTLLRKTGKQIRMHRQTGLSAEELHAI